MKYLHKYVVGETPIFILTEKPTKPSGTFSIKQEDWRGRALGRFGSVVSQLENLSFTKKEKEQAEDTPETKAKKASIVEELDKIANGLEADGRSDIALALDRISDFLEPTGE